MRLLSCHIDNFGKLANININFNEGVNIISQPNGWGKSTLAAFLKAMLYGLESKKEAKAYDKERKIYEPWQGGSYGGSLDFEINDKAYRISRTFGKTEKTDVFHLYDLDTMLEVDDYSQDIGEELFDLDSQSFKRTIFIAQADCASETSDNINAKLGNLAENTNDINNYESAAKALRELMNKMSPTRATGSIKKRQNRITAAQQEIRKFETAEEGLRSVSEKINEKQEQRVELSAIRKEYATALAAASEDSRRKALKDNYGELCRNLEARESEYDACRQIFRDRLPEEEEFSEYIQKAVEARSLSQVENSLALSDDEKARFSDLKERFEDKEVNEQIFQEEQDQISNMTSVKNEYERMNLKLTQMTSLAMLTGNEDPIPEKVKKPAMIPAGIVMLVIGIIAAAASAYAYLEMAAEIPGIYALAGCIGGAVVLVAGLILLLCGEKKYKSAQAARIRLIHEKEETRKEKEAPIQEMQEQLQQINDGIVTLEREIVGFFSVFGVKGQDMDYQKALYDLKADYAEYIRLLDKSEKLNQSVIRKNELLREIKDFIQSYETDEKSDLTLALNHLKDKALECRMAQKSYQEALDKKNAFEENNDMDKINAQNQCPYTLDELNLMISDVDNSIEDVRTAIEQYNRQMDELQEQLDLKEEKEMELDGLMEEQAREEDKFQIISLTQELLQKSKEQFTARYMAPISNGFRKYYETITGSHDGNWQVDANISVKLKESGEYRDVRSLSAGYQDLLGVCMRFALVDAMYENEKPFLILDDPFVNLDDEKLSRGKDLLITLSREYQVIYFTCNESREYHA